VKTGGLVYLESERAAGVPGVPPHWELLKAKSAGEVGYHLAGVNPRPGQ
jgi:16S rRNA G966 N2-methylase RsmD